MWYSNSKLDSSTMREWVDYSGLRELINYSVLRDMSIAVHCENG